MLEKFQKPNDMDAVNLAAIFPHLGHVEANVTIVVILVEKIPGAMVVGKKLTFGTQHKNSGRR